MRRICESAGGRSRGASAGQRICRSRGGPAEVGLWVDMTRLLHHPRSRAHAASSTLNHGFFPNLQILRHAIVSCFILVMGQNATPPGGFTNCHLLRFEGANKLGSLLAWDVGPSAICTDERILVTCSFLGFS
ncbi:uncharacterized protein LOC120681903 [Panicum virgatum]|uniref:uncharacterized protein LOC120681903 n=1 Tax=Panicum virgatum TaxID=38727 RepID=UPI0019D528BA|nr:uncharacterized protein LOC120681903 [Panicum virgatum]